MLSFDWDEKKNRSNRKKHSVWFEEAQQVFDDAAALRFYDPDHSDEEDRFLLLGVCGVGRIHNTDYFRKKSYSDGVLNL